jgi:hypothetical protein
MFRCRKRKRAAIPDKSDIRLPDRHVGLGPTTDIDEAIANAPWFRQSQQALIDGLGRCLLL